MNTQTKKHSRSPAALVGIAVDVSGSMQGSIRNRDGTSQSRFKSFQDAINRVALSGKERARELASEGAEAVEALIFAYAFGLSVSPEVADLFALITAADGVVTPSEIEEMKNRYANEIRQRYSRAGIGGLASLARSHGFGGFVDSAIADARASAENEVRSKIKNEIMNRVKRKMEKTPTVSLTLTELAQLWQDGPSTFDQIDNFIFGSTPMRQCLQQVAERFAVEGSRLPSDIHKLLIIVSDGAPTDGDPLEAVRQIRSQGVFIGTCFVTDTDVTEPRRLYGASQENWGSAARLMFEAASVLEDDELYQELLEAKGWTVEENSRLFTQINHSEMMDEFLSLVFNRAQVTG